MSTPTPTNSPYTKKRSAKEAGLPLDVQDKKRQKTLEVPIGIKPTGRPKTREDIIRRLRGISPVAVQSTLIK